MRRVPLRSLNALRRRNIHSYDVTHSNDGSVKVTTLPNKIRVATEHTPGHFAAVGLYVDAGSRYETPSTFGVSHFLDRMAFKVCSHISQRFGISFTMRQSTTSRSDLEMAQAMDKLGGQIMCSSSREAIMYQSSNFAQSTPLALSLIADTVNHPAFTPEELEAQRDAAQYEIREVMAKPEMILPEILHEVAYGHVGLGNPLLCPLDRIDKIDADVMRGFMKQWYRPERMVVAGAGMHHEDLVELVDKYFGSLKDTPALEQQNHTPLSSSPKTHPPAHLLPSSQSPSTSLYKSFTRAASSYFSPALDGLELPPSGPTYTGGHSFLAPIPPPPANPPLPALSHLYLAYEGPSIHDPDIYALATIQVLLGGGGSFSAGGPGKGMYSRLYTHILNHYSQIDHCASFNHIYTDSALFGLFASFIPRPPGQTGRGRIGRTRGAEGSSPADIFPYLVHQLSLLLYSPLPEEELRRAKNQLKSSLVMALESRSVQVEDLGRQVCLSILAQVLKYVNRSM
jgi:mitochondrial-processing peptidase subunit alpha